jgi:hypothetical protein
MNILKFNNFQRINEADTHQIPDTQLYKYFKYYKMWCDENGIESNFKDIDNEENLKKIIYQGIKYAQDNNLPNIYYNKDDS